MRFLLNWLFTTIAIAISAALVPGIAPFGFAPAWACFAFVGLALAAVNWLFYLVINAFMLELASWLSLNLFGAGIAIDGFLSAFIGAIVVSIASSLLNTLNQ